MRDDYCRRCQVSIPTGYSMCGACQADYEYEQTSGYAREKQEMRELLAAEKCKAFGHDWRKHSNMDYQCERCGHYSIRQPKAYANQQLEREVAEAIASIREVVNRG